MNISDFWFYEYSNQFAPRKSFIPKFDYEKKEGKKKRPGLGYYWMWGYE